MTRRGKNRRKHGETIGGWTPEYRAWVAIHTRCTNRNRHNWDNYGGRGIRVCERWQSSFENFLADIGRRPSPKHSLDRHPDNNGDYEPGNVRWATSAQQVRNRRNPRSMRMIEFNGKTQCLAAWAREIGISRRTLYERLEKWTLERALTQAREGSQ